MLEVMLIIGIAAMIAWRFLSYLDGMGRVQKRIKMDALQQARCKALAAKYKEEEKLTCSKCTDIKEIR